MPAFVLMKVFENTPAKYDRAMELLTLGRVGDLKREIATAVTARGGRVLELGCGTGSLAVMMAEGGARVLGIDASESMLEVARARAVAAGVVPGVVPGVDLRRLSAMDIDSLPGHSFDTVVSTLLLSELSDEEIDFVLRQTRRLLAPGGQLWIGDEVAPVGRLRRLGLALVRLPLRLAAYLVTQAQSVHAAGWARRLLYFVIELPLMLVVFLLVPSPSRPLEDIEGAVREAGFRPASVRDWLGGTLKLVRAEVV